MPRQHRPDTEDQLVAVIAEAVASERPLRLFGRGSRNGLGRPVACEDGLDLSAYSGIRLYEPEELVMRAGAGTPLTEIEAALDAERQMLAFEPPHPGTLYGTGERGASIGGTFATNMAGPRRLQAGAARDHLLGFRAVSGRAEAFKAGGRVVKNVTGYDLCKLMCGSFGTLAAMTEVTFKVLPRPEKVWTVLGFGLSAAMANRLLAEAAGSPHEVSGLCHLPADAAVASSVDFVSGAGASVTAIRVEGPGPSVEHRAGALRDLLAPHGDVEILHTHRSLALWREVRDLDLLTRPDDDRLIWRLSVTPTAGAQVLDDILRDMAGRGLLDWGGGLVWLELDAGPAEPDGGAEQLREAIVRLSGTGHATLVRGPEALRRTIPVFQPQTPPLAALSERIRRGFDPAGVLNPGRMVPVPDRAEREG